MDRRARLLQGCLIVAPPPHQRFWRNLEVSKWSNLVKFEVFEGLGPSNRTILGKRQPPFFTPREKLTPNLTIWGSRSARNTFSGPMWERKGRSYFLAIFLAFLRDPQTLPGVCGGGSSQGGGRGRSDRPQKSEISKDLKLVVQNKTGQFFSSQNEENWIDF